MPINISGSPIPAQGLSSQINTLSDQLSSGNRITSASVDAAGSAIVTRLDSELGSLSTASRNAGDAISLTQSASGLLSSVQDNLNRIQELSLQASNGALNDEDRAIIDAEAQALIEDTRDIFESSNFNGQSLFNQSDDLSVQLGGAGETSSLEGRDLLQEIEDSGLFQVSLATQEDAQDSIETLEAAREITSSRESELGAFANRLESSVDQISSNSVNVAEARSRQGDGALVSAPMAAQMATSRRQRCQSWTWYVYR